MPENPPANRASAAPREHDTFPPPSSSSSTNAPGRGGDVDPVLFHNLVEMVPLIESLMDRRVAPSYTRRASVIFTPKPSQQQKVINPEGRKTAHTVSAKKHGDVGEYGSSKHGYNGDGAADDFSIFSSRSLTEEEIQKNKEETTMLQEQLDELNKKLSEKDEALKSANDSLSQMSSLCANVDEMRRQIAEKDTSIKSAKAQLSNTNIKLTDKQASLEKLEWEARTANQNLEELQEDLESMGFEINAFMRFFEEVSKSDSFAHSDIDITSFDNFVHLPYIDNTSDKEMEKIEKARIAYTAALDAAREEPCIESLTAAAEARQKLQALVL